MTEIGVLTAKPDLEIYRELEAAGEKLGVRVAVIDSLRAVAQASPAGVWCDGAFLDTSRMRLVLPRVGNWRPDSTLAVLAALEAAGVPPVNPIAAIRRGRDHWRTACAMAAAGLPHPRTVAGSEPETLAAAAAELCGFPCVVKQRRSRQGVGVIRCGGKAELDAVLDTLWRLGDEVVVQRFCPPGGISRRVLVVRGEVIGAAEHHAEGDEFRANAARGGAVSPLELEPRLAELAVAAADVVGLGFAGVDLLPDGHEWVVGEVNPTPGWRRFAVATGIAVGERLIRALVPPGEGS
jgi:gamma-F420-2:alpha-L-glutamate ligase